MTSPLPLPCEILHLNTRLLGRCVHIYDSLPSTNDVAMLLAAEPVREGSVVLAKFQTAGRGQHGRSWQSGAGQSVLMSVILNPPAELRRPVVVTAWAAVAIADAIFQLTSLQAHIKWPNDLMLRGRKVCGILVEQGIALVVGIGMNVNQSQVELTEAELPGATSLAITDGIIRDQKAVASTIIHRLDEEYTRLTSGEFGSLESEWKWRVGLLGQRVQIELTDGSTLVGRLKEITFNSLELETTLSYRLAFLPEQIRHIVPC